ncbi:type IV toxin-antitoxin system AbiEi family antitoxin [Herbiconiux sp. A18JL235]|uniref:Type IV toxin-antitoxin system AbiEi family antitoxin n=1 Tax=Herbiconiux sp. A18JL235 TaxID=3152363 RepID=A0AB39BMH4_9MICO
MLRSTVFPLLLDSVGLPEVELCAAHLDRTVVRVGGSFVPADVAVGAELRAGALLGEVPGGLVAERSTAAWVHGACPRQAGPPQLCVPAPGRASPARRGALRVRQVVLADHDVETISGLRLTTVRRTALDLLRQTEAFDRRAAVTVSTLLLAGDISTAAARAELERSEHLPLRHRAIARLALFDAAGGVLPRPGRSQPPVTR